MSYGLEIYNASGQLIFSPTSRWAKIYTYGSVSYISGTGTSTTSVVGGTGSKTFTMATTTVATFVAGSSITITSDIAPVITLTGTVTSYNTTTRILVVNVNTISGSGTRAAWTMRCFTSIAVPGFQNNDNWTVINASRRDQNISLSTSTELLTFTNTSNRDIVSADQLTYWVIHQ
jgi:hypothetical protein